MYGVSTRCLGQMFGVVSYWRCPLHRVLPAMLPKYTISSRRYGDVSIDSPSHYADRIEVGSWRASPSPRAAGSSQALLCLLKR